MLDHYCPNCGASNDEGWYFSVGYVEVDGMQIDPDEGSCSNCGFQYHQHVKHSLKKQLEKFRDNPPSKGGDE